MGENPSLTPSQLAEMDKSIFLSDKEVKEAQE
jgi:hypothetical protein